MLALVTGAGRLPELIQETLAAGERPFCLCRLDPDAPADFHVTLGTLGSLIRRLKERGVTEICFAGAIDRRNLHLGDIDAETLPLMQRLQVGLASGDARGLDIIISIFEEAGLRVVGAHEICPDLLPAPGVLTRAKPSDRDRADAARAAEIFGMIAPADLGQGVVVEGSQALGVETLPGTDHMLASVGSFRAGRPVGGVFFKAPKPSQDMRADLPTIGPSTADAVIKAGLAGLVIQAGAVMILDRDELVARLDAADRFLWVRDADQ